MTLQLFNEEGDPFEYSKLSERLPTFLQQYPPEHYSIITEMTDMLSMMPGTLSLLEKFPSDSELLQTARELAGRLVCRASLLDKEGNVIQTASASGFLDAIKGYEILETAARQRLVAACGFAGDMLDLDERMGFDAQGITESEPAAQTQTASEIPPATKTETAMTESPDSSDESNASESSDTPPDTSGTGSDHETEQQEETPEPDIPASLIRQIDAQAKLKKVEVPDYTDLVSAKAALSHLYGLPRVNAAA